jgi:NADH dehydrogenase
MVQRIEMGPHVVIVGGGFGGLTAARALAHTPVRVTLVDRTNHHTFQPLLYQVATAGLSPADIAQPIRSILHNAKNVTVLLGEVTGVDLKAQRLLLDGGGTLDWDFLVLACGAETSYFGHDEWRNVAPGLKNLEDAFDIRTRVLLAFELAEREADPLKRQALLNFVVIGGGPTGVELAGALAEISRYAFDRDFRRVDTGSTNILLLEAGPRILPAFSEDLSQSAKEQLEELGVQVRTGAFVTHIEPGMVHLRDGQVPGSVVLWAAGVRTAPLTKTLGVPLDPSGRVMVEPDLSIPGHPHAFVIGDAAHSVDEKGAPLPGVSPVAMQEARFVAKAIRRRLEGRQAVSLRPTERFQYFDKGQLATVGRSRAIAMFRRIHLTHFVAWLAWLFVHVFYLIGFKNRVIVLITWAWSYLTYKRGARLITGEQRQREAARVLSADVEREVAQQRESAPVSLVGGAPATARATDGVRGPRTHA